MNVVLAIAVLTGLFMVSYEKVLERGRRVIGHVMPDSPAAKAGIQAGDKIVRLNGKDNPDWEEIITKEIEGAERTLTVTIERNGHRFPVSRHPRSGRKGRRGSTPAGKARTKSRSASVNEGYPAAARRSEEGRSACQSQQHSRSIRATRLPEVIRKSDGKPVTIEYVRDGVHHTVTLKPVFKNPDGTRRAG